MLAYDDQPVVRKAKLSPYSIAPKVQWLLLHAASDYYTKYVEVDVNPTQIATNPSYKTELYNEVDGKHRQSESVSPRTLLILEILLQQLYITYPPDTSSSSSSSSAAQDDTTWEHWEQILAYVSLSIPQYLYLAKKVLNTFKIAYNVAVEEENQEMLRIEEFNVKHRGLRKDERARRTKPHRHLKDEPLLSRRDGCMLMTGAVVGAISLYVYMRVRR